jgi:phospholipid/cholesterol/gamma-HCH transport system substrate-binding protein
MKRSIGVKYGKLKVGLMLAFALAILMWASLTGGGTSIFETKNEFVCYFKNVNGLLRGSPIWMSGVEVGNVRSVTFVNIDSIKQVKVTCRVKSEVWPMMTTDARVQLGTIGFLGDKYIEVIPGSKGLPVISEMSEVMVEDVGEATKMFKAGEDAINDVRSITKSADSVLGRMSRGVGTLGKLSKDSILYTQLTKLITNLTTLTEGLQQNQERLTKSLERTSNAVADLSDKVNNNKGTLGKLVNDPGLYNNLSSTSASLDSVVRKMNSSQGSLGMMVNDTAMYVEVKNLVSRVNNLVTDIEKNPRKYFKFSVF